MNYNLLVDGRKRFIVLKVEGDLYRSAAATQYSAALLLCREEGIPRLLIDVRRARAVDSSRDQYSFVQFDLKRLFSQEAHPRMAVLTRKGDRSHGHVVLLMKQAGLEIEGFNELKAAEDFLEQRSEQYRVS